MKKKRILIACEFSGIGRESMRKTGHDVWSCDILPTEIPGNHIQGDVLNILEDGWDMIIAHPPCTYLANSGVRWLYKDGGKNIQRWESMYMAANFFNQFKGKAPVVVIENPIPHKYARDIIGDYSQIIQPWQFGHGETKATCLWLHGAPKLKPSKIVSGREARVHMASPGPNRWKERSLMLPGIANAMTEQWGSL